MKSTLVTFVSEVGILVARLMSSEPKPDDTRGQSVVNPDDNLPRDRPDHAALFAGSGLNMPV